ncbi:uncharacterized protein LOC122298932 [Carya illinoinensis]|nr:uncharacterized protein LOC122293864 [Carya illinoinensis]XP_042964711.1 uncharacterized protein LOC122298932 [Carya illinoinensis]
MEDGVLSSLYEGLKLTDEEKQEIEVSTEEISLSTSKSKLCIMVCLISDKETNRGALMGTLPKIWNAEGKIVFKEVGRNKFLVEFKSRSDKIRVLNGRPWSFDKSLLCIQDCEGAKSIKEMQFCFEPFWIQCHDMPFAGMTASMGQKLGSSLGKVLMVDTDGSETCWGKFLRVKVMLDITKPLARGRFISQDGEKFWIPFKYERMANFCYHCGSIKHGHGTCENIEKGLHVGASLGQQYGAWLRASNKKQVKSAGKVRKMTDDGGSSESGRRVSSDESTKEDDNYGKVPEAVRQQAGSQSLHTHEEAAPVSARRKVVEAVESVMQEGGQSPTILLEESQLGPVVVEESKKERKVPSSGHSWKRRAREARISPTNQGLEEEIIVTKHNHSSKRKAQEIYEGGVEKRSKLTLVDEEGDELSMAVAVEQPCQLL